MQVDCSTKKRIEGMNMIKKISLLLIFALVTIAIVGCGQNSNNDDKLISKKYLEAVKHELSLSPYGAKSINYGFEYVDDDIIPELFVVTGSSHIDTVAVYTFDLDKREAVKVGNYGSQGRCSIIPNKNTIISSYGNQGIFYTVVSGFDKDKNSYLRDVILRCGFEEPESYYGFELAGFNGSMDNGYDFNQFDWPGEEYLIDENQADDIVRNMLDGAEEISTNTICTSIYSLE